MMTMFTLVYYTTSLVNGLYRQSVYKLTMVILILDDRTYATYMFIFRQYLQWQLQVKIINIMMSLHKIPIVGYDWHNEISE